MPMVKCKKCGTDVSKSAIKCPACKTWHPGMTKKDYIIAGSVIGIFTAILLNGAAQNPSGKGKNDPACKLDLTCWGQAHSNDADVKCATEVEKLAKHAFRWTTSFGEPKFSQFGWLDQQAASLRYVGNKVEFQNGLGLYQAHSYECHYDPANETVIGVQITD